MCFVGEQMMFSKLFSMLHEYPTMFYNVYEEPSMTMEVRATSVLCIGIISVSHSLKIITQVLSNTAQLSHNLVHTFFDFLQLHAS